ncbi:DUF3375 family protein, partial [Actinomadura sp. 7K507]|uniref:DUF3375 family protein n=1 Tax=Actinomadura sp. 7K507 TaxID=2530365 RepID=UPI001051861B
QPPTPLQEWDEAEDVPSADTRAWGGPQYADLRAHLEAFAGDADEVDVAAVFRAAAERIRRPVDLLGLLEIAHDLGMTGTAEVAVVEAVRPDRTRRRLAFGGVRAANPEPPRAAEETAGSNDE